MSWYLLQILSKTVPYCHPDCSAHIENERLLLQPLGETTHDQLLPEAQAEQPNSRFKRSIFLQKYFYGENWDLWGSAADGHLYWDSDCNEMQEMKCIFWWFFESAGPQKRSHTLPELTSIKKHICNIKWKIIYFSACFFFRDRFSSKIWCILLLKASLCQHTDKKSCILL